MCIRDSNGSFVGRRRIEGSCLLEENDIVHFGTAEFRVRMRAQDQTRIDQMGTMLVPNGLALSELFVPNEPEFLDFLDGEGVSGAAQPIVDAISRRIVAYELLGRANALLDDLQRLGGFELKAAVTGLREELAMARGRSLDDVLAG